MGGRTLWVCMETERQCSWTEGCLKVSVSWYPGPYQLLTPLLFPDQIGESASFKRPGCNQRHAGSPRRNQGREDPAGDSRADYWNGSYLLSDPEGKRAWEAIPAGPKELGMYSPRSPCSALSASDHGLFLQRERLWPAKYLPRRGSFNVDSVGTMWPQPTGDLLSCQLCSGRRQ